MNQRLLTVVKVMLKTKIWEMTAIAIRFVQEKALFTLDCEASVANIVN